MAFYKEAENYIIRDYQLKDNNNIDIYKTRRALVEIAHTELFDDMLFIDGELQLSKKDEYIYHEMLIHPALIASSASEKRVCIIGGGDGCAAREVLRWKDVKTLTIIDWDREFVELFSNKYAHWNDNAFKDPRVSIETIDIRSAINQDREYDCIIIDLFDPSNQTNESIQLWNSVLHMAKSWLSKEGSVVINGGSILPWNFKIPLWLLQMIHLVFQNTSKYDLMLYKTFVPSFASEWCFFLIAEPTALRSERLETCKMNLFINNLRYFDTCSWLKARSWTKDYCGFTGSALVKLNTYRPPLQCVRDD